jgi:beta-N-acetylhexosaminidase
MTPGPLMIDLDGTTLTGEDRELLRHPLVGSVIYFSRNYESPQQLAALTAAIRDVRPELCIAVDYEGGRVQRFRDGFTRLPPMRRVGELYARDAEAGLQLAEVVGRLMAVELGAMDIDMPLAPVVDLDTGCCEVIGDRAFDAGAPAVLALSLALRRGLNQGGMAATAKHFPGHGSVREDSHHELPVDPRSLDDLAGDLAPYRGLIAQGLESVMMAHIRYPAVDEAPASLSSHWIRTRLRSELGFRGVVFCDDLSMGGAASVGDYRVRARLALDAGCDVLPVCNNRAAVIELLAGFSHERAMDGAERRAGLKRSAGRAADAQALQAQMQSLLSRLPGGAA